MRNSFKRAQRLDPYSFITALSCFHGLLLERSELERVEAVLVDWDSAPRTRLLNEMSTPGLGMLVLENRFARS